MKRVALLSLVAITLLATVLTTSSCVPRRHPAAPPVVVLPGHPHGPVGVPKPKIVRPPSPFPGAVWVEPVYHWDGKRWVVRKQGYWMKSKNVPPGKAKGHHK